MVSHSSGGLWCSQLVRFASGASHHHREGARKDGRMVCCVVHSRKYQ